MGNAIKPRLAKGTRDFSPSDMALRNHILDVIKVHFNAFGFEQIETPAVENLETLTGKYGEEGDRLIFKILNSGDYLRNVDESLLREKDSNALIPQLCEKALRYDLTVPFARYVVQHRNDINFPFRRYQIQPVWRADRPQKGRYREFYQCDADVIGSDSLIIEAEFIDLIHRVFTDLKIPATIKVNSRKILLGFCQAMGMEKDFVTFTTILDKLDKKDWTDLKEEFSQAGFADKVIQGIEVLRELNGLGFTASNLDAVEKKLSLSDLGKKGLTELRETASYLSGRAADMTVIDLSLARGLNYYTGAILEVVANDVNMGSVCGGGRYDDLTGIFGLDDMSGMGISFGIDRIFDILSEGSGNQLKPNRHVVFVNFGAKEAQYSMKALSSLRTEGITAELYPDADKLKKQFKYADQKGASHVITAGASEMEKGIFGLKDLRTGNQEEYDLKGLIQHLKS